MTPEELLTPKGMREYASKSNTNALAASMPVMLLNGIERYKRILYLRAELERLRNLASEVQRELDVTEGEQKADSELIERIMDSFERTAKIEFPAVAN